LSAAVHLCATCVLDASLNLWILNIRKWSLIWLKWNYRLESAWCSNDRLPLEKNKRNWKNSASKIIYRRGQSKYEFIHPKEKDIFTAAILSKSKTQHFWDETKEKFTES
jgi:hypothetical protein